ncbi:hypothetical protein ACH50O_00610 [Methylomonas sp. 2BW1-5-20]|uniref:hypothetical protein n=1 Tax=Methylomonas sp. 2BW1-5-20 TaxID=3376686 RepID=UPI004051F3C9
MKAQLSPKSVGRAEQTATLNAVKPAAGAPAIAPDSAQQLSFWRGEVDDFINELSKLRCLSGLLAGQQSGSGAIELSELSCLMDPSIDRLKEICDGVTELFYQKQVAFLQTAGERSTKTDAS